MLSPASLDIVRQGVSKIAAATVSPPRHALPPLPPPRTSPVVADGSEGAPFDLGVESPQAHDPLRTKKPALPPRERDVDEAARRAFEQSAAEAADAAIVAGCGARAVAGAGRGAENGGRRFVLFDGGGGVWACTSGTVGGGGGRTGGSPGDAPGRVWEHPRAARAPMRSRFAHLRRGAILSVAVGKLRLGIL